MLICNNCSTTNQDDAVRCVHCNMRDNFTRRHGEPQSDQPVADSEAVVICRNCGSDAPGEGAKCRHCHFPIPLRRPQYGQHSSPAADATVSIQQTQR